MKEINYDAEGDILALTFAEAGKNFSKGIELSDNIVLYYDPDTEQPLKLLLLSYQAMLQASLQAPIFLDGLARAPIKVQKTVTAILKQSPVTAFMQLVEVQDKVPFRSQIQEIFTPNLLQKIPAFA